MKAPVQGVLALTAIVLVVAGAACLEGQASGQDGKVANAGAPDVVGKVGDRTFTLEEVDRAAMQTNLKAFQDVYEARRQALQSLIDDELIARAAKAKGVSADELIAQEVTAKVPPVTDEDVSNFYQQNEARMGGRTLDQVGPQIRQYLEAVNGNQARADYLGQLRDGAKITMNIEPPRIEMRIAENDPSKGPADAAVTVVEYSDFQ